MRNCVLLTALVFASVLCSAQTPAPFRVHRQFLYPKEFAPGKPYSPGVLAGKTLYIAGQIDKDPRTGAQPSGIREQTRMAMNNMGHVLHAAGMDFGNVVSCHVQLRDMGQYKDMNEVYGSFFGPDHYPARTTLEFPGLPGGANIEISCIAYADKSKISIVTPPRGSIPPAMGPYRPAVFAGDTLYVSGSGGRTPAGNELDPTLEGQTRQTMENIGQILKAAGLEHKDAVFANVYYLDPAGPKNGAYARLGSVYKNFFPLGSAPSRAGFLIGKLPGTISVEITFIATRDRKHKGRVVPDSAGLSPTSSNGGVLDRDTLYTSGKSGAGSTLEAQMRDSLETIRGILKLAGMDLENIVDTHVYLKDSKGMDAMNAVYKEYFPKNPPARTTVQVFQDQLIQVQAVAVR
ncbi:MAG: hypothetical protein IT166_02605 [Bryobacterales bacterium]|nr:hypothetical protein [Bryobacterales bacterium]